MPKLNYFLFFICRLSDYVFPVRTSRICAVFILGRVPSSAIFLGNLTDSGHWAVFLHLLGQPKSAIVEALSTAQTTAHRLSPCPNNWAFDGIFLVFAIFYRLPKAGVEALKVAEAISKAKQAKVPKNTEK